jgi:hypothetical protein
MPPRTELKNADWTKFGWMVHVHPYEDSLDKIFSMHHHME